MYSAGAVSGRLSDTALSGETTDLAVDVVSIVDAQRTVEHLTVWRAGTRSSSRTPNS